MDRNAIEQLIKIAEDLDNSGMDQEATLLTAAASQLIEKKAEEMDEGDERTDSTGLNKKTTKALNTLKSALDSFCSKNLDSRGEKRRKLNAVLDLAEDLNKAIDELASGAE